MKKYVVVIEEEHEMPVAKVFDSLDELIEFVESLQREEEARAAGQEVAKKIFIRDVVNIMFTRYPEPPKDRSYLYIEIPETEGIACVRLNYVDRTLETVQGFEIKNFQDIPVDTAWALSDVLNSKNYEPLF